MRRILLSALAALPLFAFSQVTILTENFDSYNDQDYAGVVSPWMSTWSGATGGAEDCRVTSAESSSPSNSITITGPQAGGTTDAMLVFPSNYTSGRFELSFKYKVAASMGGYFNLQSNGTTPGTAWLAEVFFASDGTGNCLLGGQALTFNYTNDAWIDVVAEIDIDSDMAHLIIDGTEVGSGFQISLEATGSGTGANMSFGGANFYSYAAQAPAVGDCEYYVDDIMLVETTGVGLNETVLEPAISVYPNPSTGNFAVKFEDMSMDRATVTLVDLLGKTIYNEQMSIVGDGYVPFNMNLRNGVYFVTVSDGSQKMTKKIVVRK
ncbi:MAG: hypothetical protein A3D92_11990 [Bacteroidetes bacterium RIFCSPHIGHO2_02_FULL_44_7]|nr:MAG: hypothetical protein A3D92_11990 [Bacteroidetes bacterium RIFCSPHIGHO2_02_FULL_44_7]